MSEVRISASREGFHCSHCGWLAKVGSDESDRDHQADCPWRAFMAQAKKCSTCGGAGWTTEPHPASGEPVEVQCRACGEPTEPAPPCPKCPTGLCGHTCDREECRDHPLHSRHGLPLCVDEACERYPDRHCVCPTNFALFEVGPIPSPEQGSAHEVGGGALGKDSPSNPAEASRPGTETELKRQGQNRRSEDPLVQHEWARDYEGKRIAFGLDRVKALHAAAGEPEHYSATAGCGVIREWYRIAVEEILGKGEWVPTELHPDQWMSGRNRGRLKNGAFVRTYHERHTHRAPGYWSLGDGLEVLVFVVPLEPRADTTGFLEYADEFIEKLEAAEKSRRPSDGGGTMDEFPGDFTPPSEPSEELLRHIANPPAVNAPRDVHAAYSQKLEDLLPEEHSGALAVWIGTWCDDRNCYWQRFDLGHWHCVEGCKQAMFEGTLLCDRAPKCLGRQPVGFPVPVR